MRGFNNEETKEQKKKEAKKKRKIETKTYYSVYMPAKHPQLTAYLFFSAVSSIYFALMLLRDFDIVADNS